MGTNSNTALTNLVLLASLSSSVISLPYDSSVMLIPNICVKYSHNLYISDWKENAFNNSPDYTFQNSNSEKIQKIIQFSQKVLENTTNIESEYVNIVNENFWDLI